MFSVIFILLTPLPKPTPTFIWYQNVSGNLTLPYLNHIRRKLQIIVFFLYLFAYLLFIYLFITLKSWKVYIHNWGRALHTRYLGIHWQARLHSFEGIKEGTLNSCLDSGLSPSRGCTSWNLSPKSSNQPQPRKTHNPQIISATCVHLWAHTAGWSLTIYKTALALTCSWRCSRSHQTSNSFNDSMWQRDYLLCTLLVW